MYGEKREPVACFLCRYMLIAKVIFLHKEQKQESLANDMGNLF